MKIQIKSSWGSLLFEGDFSTIAEALAAAVKSGADLSGADLSGANLSGANLGGAVLRNANLSDAVLSGAVHTWAQVAFKGHGECGRMLTAVRIKDGDAPKLWCGCFGGNTKELREYITNGNPRLAKTRTMALDAVLMMLDASNDPE